MSMSMSIELEISKQVTRLCEASNVAERAAIQEGLDKLYHLLNYHRTQEDKLLRLAMGSASKRRRRRDRGRVRALKLLDESPGYYQAVEVRRYSHE